MFEYREKLIAIIFIDMNSSNNKLKHSRVNLIETTTAIITTTSITTKMTTAVPSTTSATIPTTQMKTTSTTATTDTTITIGTAITYAATVKTTTPFFNELNIPDITLPSISSPTDEPMAKLGLENPTPTSDSLMLRPSRFCILGISILLKFLLNF